MSVLPEGPQADNGPMKASSLKALTAKARLHPDRIVRALRYPTYERLALQQALGPAVGSIMTGVGNLCSSGLGGLHGSGNISVMSAHILTYVIVAPAGQKNAAT